MTRSRQSPVALVTGGSRGLGLATTRALAGRGWQVVVDGRDAARLTAAVVPLPDVHPVPGDVTDPSHRAALAEQVARLGGLDLLVSSASVLGTSPLGPLSEHPLPQLHEVFEVNCLAPLALVQLLLPSLRSRSGRVVVVSSDAAVEAYPHWGAYGAAKAAADHALRVLALEVPELRWYSLDPGEMDTDLLRSADPTADLSGVPGPDAVAPALLRLALEDLVGGRYRAEELLGTSTAAVVAS